VTGYNDLPCLPEKPTSQFCCMITTRGCGYIGGSALVGVGAEGALACVGGLATTLMNLSRY
jgi:hypothetical protein